MTRKRFNSILGIAILAAWQATASAQSITDAVVRVIAGDAAGCGTLILAGDRQGYVLTAAHVVENGRPPRAVWHDGQTAAAQVIAASGQLDVALLAVVPPPGARAIPLASSEHWPERGDTVELIGYGGGNLRHWQANVNGYAMTDGIGRYQTLSLNTRTIGGDSGGAIVFQGKLVGVIWGGPLAGPRGPMLATHGTSCVAIEPFLKQHNIDLSPSGLAQIIRPASPSCRGPNCPLPSRYPPPVTPSTDTQRLLESIKRLEDRIAGLERHPNLNINVDDVSRRLVEAMAADPRFRGPAGADGKPGRDGATGTAEQIDIDHLANQIKQRLAGSIRIRVEPVRDKVTR